MRRDYYVYFLFREEGGEPFYVGKGTRNRWAGHEKDALAGGSSHKARIIRKIIIELSHLPKKKIAEGLTEEEAFALEVRLIADIGRYPNGPLVNKTDGGDGVSGFKFSEEQNKQNAKRAVDYWKDPIIRANMMAGVDKTWNDPVKRSRILDAIKKALDDPIIGKRARSAQSESLRVNWSQKLEDPELSKQISERMSRRGRKGWEDPDKKVLRVEQINETWAKNLADPEFFDNFSKKMSEQASVYWAKPESHKKASAAAQKSWEDPEVKAFRSKTIKDGLAKKLEDPEAREKLTEDLTIRSQTYWKNPESRKKKSVEVKDRWEKMLADPELHRQISEEMSKKALEGWVRRRERAAEAKNKTID